MRTEHTQFKIRNIRINTTPQKLNTRHLLFFYKNERINIIKYATKSTNYCDNIVMMGGKKGKKR